MPSTRRQVPLRQQQSDEGCSHLFMDGIFGKTWQRLYMLEIKAALEGEVHCLTIHISLHMILLGLRVHHLSAARKQVHANVICTIHVNIICECHCRWASVDVCHATALDCPMTVPQHWLAAMQGSCKLSVKAFH